MTWKRVMAFKILSNSLRHNKLKTADINLNIKTTSIQIILVQIYNHNNIMLTISRTKNLKIGSSKLNLNRKALDNLKKINKMENMKKLGIVLVKEN